MLPKLRKFVKSLKEFVKKYQTDIILIIGVILISLLSFAIGYIVAKEQEKEPIKIEKSTNSEFITNLLINELRKIPFKDNTIIFADLL